jgi:two-component system chemotaxis sensor kinase CheA
MEKGCCMSMDYSVFDSLQDSALVIDENYGVYYANQAASFLLDVSVKRLKNAKPLSDFINFKAPLATRAEMPESGSNQMRELEYTTPSGKAGALQVNMQIDTSTIAQSEEQAKRWIVFLRDVSLEKILHTKYMGELDKKESVINDLRVAQAQLEDYSKNLETKVEQRTLELRNANQLMSAILNSLDQGILVFDQSGHVLPYFSKISRELFQREIENSNVIELLSADHVVQSQLRDWLSVTFEEMLDFEDMKALGPERLDRRDDVEISLRYNAMRGSGGKLDAIVMVATDKTDEMRAKKEADHERSLARRVMQITKYRSQFRSFSEDALLICSRSIEAITSVEAKQVELDRESFSRDLHTFKGGAATFALSDLATLAHHAETILSKLDLDPAHQLLELKKAMESLKSQFCDFLEQNKELYGGSLNGQLKQIEISNAKATEWLDKLRANPAVKELYLEIENLFFREKIGDHFSYLDESLGELAQALGKKMTPIKIVNGELRIEAKHYRELFANFIHIFRNAIDHGLETPEERLQIQKSEEGHIEVAFAFKENQNQKSIEIIVRDDGAGINPEKIRARMLTLGYSEADCQKSDEEIIQVIFDDRFSSRDQVSEISGRGVGLAALKNSALNLGGQAWVQTVLGQSTKFVVEVPFLVGSAQLTSKLEPSVLQNSVLQKIDTAS